MNEINLDIPSAADARKVFEQGEYQKAKKQGAEIGQRIKNAIAAGATSITLTKESLEIPVKIKLVALGYKVRYGGQMDDDSIYISW